MPLFRSVQLNENVQTYESTIRWTNASIMCLSMILARCHLKSELYQLFPDLPMVAFHSVLTTETLMECNSLIRSWYYRPLKWDLTRKRNPKLSSVSGPRTPLWFHSSQQKLQKFFNSCKSVCRDGRLGVRRIMVLQPRNTSKWQTSLVFSRHFQFMSSNSTPSCTQEGSTGRKNQKKFSPVCRDGREWR